MADVSKIIISDYPSLSFNANPLTPSPELQAAVTTAPFFLADEGHMFIFAPNGYITGGTDTANDAQTLGQEANGHSMWGYPYGSSAGKGIYETLPSDIIVSGDGSQDVQSGNLPTDTGSGKTGQMLSNPSPSAPTLFDPNALLNTFNPFAVCL